MIKYLSIVRDYIQKEYVFLQNISLMSIFGVVDLLLPLISFPYRASVLGPINFGILILIQSYIIYINLFIDQGFSISGTRRVSIVRKNILFLKKIYSSILILKFFIGTFVFSISLILFKLFNHDSEFYYYIILSGGVIFGQIFYAKWFFHGLNDFKTLVGINIFAKITFTILVFTQIKSTEDLKIALVVNSIGGFILGFASLLIMFTKYRFSVKWPGIKFLKMLFMESLSVFWSLSISNLYLNLTPILLNEYMGKTSVAFYGVSYKLIQVFKLSYTVMTQVTFPNISKQLKSNIHEGLKSTFFYIKITIILPLIITILVFLYSEFIIFYIFGEQYMGAVLYLKVLSFLPLICSISSLSINTLYGLKLDNNISKIFLIGLLLFLASFYILSHFQVPILLIIPIIITELYISFATLNKIYKLNNI